MEQVEGKVAGVEVKVAGVGVRVNKVRRVNNPENTQKVSHTKSVMEKFEI